MRIRFGGYKYYSDHYNIYSRQNEYASLITSYAISKLTDQHLCHLLIRKRHITNDVTPRE